MEIATEVLVEVASGEYVSVINVYWRYRHVLAWFLTQQIYKVVDGVRIIGSRERAGVIDILLTGLNSSNRVIIVADAGKFKRVKNRKCTGIIGALLT